MASPNSFAERQWCIGCSSLDQNKSMSLTFVNVDIAQVFFKLSAPPFEQMKRAGTKVEVCAGEGNLSRALQRCGYQTKAFDVSRLDSYHMTLNGNKILNIAHTSWKYRCYLAQGTLLWQPQPPSNCWLHDGHGSCEYPRNWISSSVTRRWWGIKQGGAWKQHGFKLRWEIWKKDLSFSSHRPVQAGCFWTLATITFLPSAKTDKTKWL